MKIIGPVSYYYYKNLPIDDTDDLRNILLFGDAHFSLYWEEDCCKNGSAVTKSIVELNTHLLLCYYFMMNLDIIISSLDYFQTINKSNQNLNSNPNQQIQIDLLDDLVKKLDTQYYKTIHNKFLNLIRENKIYFDKLIKVLKSKNKIIPSNGFDKTNVKVIKQIENNLNKLNNLYTKNLTKTIKKLFDDLSKDNTSVTDTIDKNKHCVLVSNFIFNLAKKSKCLDFYYESNVNRNFIDYKRINNGYIELVFLLFHLIKYIGSHMNKYSAKIFDNFELNARLHESDIRALEKLNVKFINQIYIKSIYSDDMEKVYSKSIFYVKEHLNFIKWYLLTKTNPNIDFTKSDKMDVSNKYKTELIDLFDETDKQVLFGQLDLISKQYSKSIFSDDNIDTLFNFLFFITSSQFDKEKNLFIERFIKNFYFELEMLHIDIYTLFRFFIKKGGWDTSKHMLRNKCGDQTYPKNIIGYYGFVHVSNYVEFIKYYFAISKKEKSNFISLKEISEIKPLEPTSFETNVDFKSITRCVDINSIAKDFF
jgi:hypothetical protein